MTEPIEGLADRGVVSAACRRAGRESTSTRSAGGPGADRPELSALDLVRLLDRPGVDLVHRDGDLFTSRTSTHPAVLVRGWPSMSGWSWERSAMIEARALTKRYGEQTAVDELTFSVRPGVVTGFLGPNGAGKSTTMRLILGLDRPTAGSVTVAGRAYRDWPAPLCEVGALLEARSVHPGRSASAHLRALAATHGIGVRRVREVIELVGLEEVVRRHAGTFSLGMGQRLGIAVALLGDPGVLLLDEPANGLDPEGIRWIRGLLRELAGEGRTVFVSSHLMSEMAQTAEHLIVIGRGRLIANTSVEEFIHRASRSAVRVRSPQVAELTRLLAAPDVHVDPRPDGSLEVSGLSAAQVGDLAVTHRVPLHELSPVQASLEEAFMELTTDSVDYHGQTPTMGQVEAAR